MKSNPYFGINFLKLLFILSFGVLGLRLIYIQVFAHDNFRKKALNQQVTQKTISYDRGEIFSSDGFVLATNNVTYTMTANPSRIKDVDLFLKTVSSKIKFDSEDEKNKFVAKIKELYNPSSYYLVVKKGLTKDEKESIEKEKIADISFEKELRRFYPEGDLASNVLGFVASSETEKFKGYYGIEGRNDKLLKGREGKVTYERGADGQVILFGDYSKHDSIDGDSIVLTIDRSVQYILENQLKKGVEKFGAKSGQIVVMDPKSGDVLGMANYPNFDPYDPYKEYLDENKKIKSEIRNKSISDNLEPGSVIKPLTIAAALDLGLIDLNYTFQDNGVLKLSDTEVDNWDKKHHGTMSLIDLLQKSNNIGSSLIGLKLGSKNISEYFSRFGFGRTSSIDLEGEEIGYLKKGFWADIDIASAAFGQGFTATPLQVLSSYTVFLNEGNLIKPKIIKYIKKSNGEQIKYPNLIEKNAIKRETADNMNKLLVKSIEGNESKYFNIKNYHIGGKTGTAQIAKDGKYLENKTNALFVGYLASSKKFSMIVRLEEPSSSPYAAETAVPLWMDTASELINYYNISPDIKY